MVKYLAIGPGAMGYYLYLGAVSKLVDSGRLNELEEIAGASAGALLGFMYCLMKGDVQKILDYSMKIPVRDIMKINLKILFKKFGLISFRNIRKILSEACMSEYGQADMTFLELYKFSGIKLHVTAYCVQLERTKYFGPDATPGTSVIDAVCASIAIPFLFSSITLDDDMNYIDGGSMETTPSGAFIGRDGVLAMRLGTTGWDPDVRDIKTYALSLLYATMKLRYEYQVPTHHLEIRDDVFDFGASSESKIRMFTSGYGQEFSQ
jgi:predicted acylesterase/phospholipase RssA